MCIVNVLCIIYFYFQILLRIMLKDNEQTSLLEQMIIMYDLMMIKHQPKNNPSRDWDRYVTRTNLCEHISQSLRTHWICLF